MPPAAVQDRPAAAAPVAARRRCAAPWYRTGVPRRRPSRAGAAIRAHRRWTPA